MLAKQLWRLIEKPNTLFSRVSKGRYYRNASPLEPIRSYSPTYGWRSIVSARSLVSKWLIKRVGTRSSISVWNDPWLPTTLAWDQQTKFNKTVSRTLQWMLSSTQTHERWIFRWLEVWWIHKMRRLSKEYHWVGLKWWIGMDDILLIMENIR